MEAHSNSTACFINAATGAAADTAAAATAASGGRKKAERSDLLTVKNFGSRTGLHWPEERVVKEIAGYVCVYVVSYVRSLPNDAGYTEIVEIRPDTPAARW